MSQRKERFIHLYSPKFPILEGEDEEIGNPGMYGRALSTYIQEGLQKKGYESPFLCAEDWGWWIEIKGAPFKVGVCVYSGPGKDGVPEYGVLVGIKSARSWSWSSFKMVETKEWEDRVFGDLLALFESDPHIEVFGVKPDCPVYAEDWPQATSE